MRARPSVAGFFVLPVAQDDYFSCTMNLGQIGHLVDDIV